MSANATQENGEKKKKKLPLPMIIGVVLLVVALFVGKSVMGSKPAEKEKTKKTRKSKAHKESKERSKEHGHGKKHDAHEDETSEEEEEEIEVGHAMALDEFMVNLSGGGDHYLRATIALGLRKGLSEEKVKHHVHPIRDAILSVLTSKTLKDLSTPGGREQLKRELLQAVNEAVEEEEEPIAGKIYFSAFATQ
ncbi:MAG: flagellar basal body-associated FliL family protein [Chloroherpetonaceae bacterium]|nr:flagellar basal body-associated FliL family protein [Chthonomonadaceae bacterium]MDW8209198.1 flagellar basal body-associated FliL family protein [Chloroherpetonaceae bacterium]